MPYFVSKATGLDMGIALFAYIMALLCVSGAMLAYGLSSILKLPQPATVLVVASYILALTVMTTSVYAEREHIIAMVIVPFALLQWGITQRVPLKAGIVWPFFLLGGLSIFMKPHHGLIPALMVLHCLWLRRDLYLIKDQDFGISSTQLPETELKEGSIKNAPHYYLMAGYDWAIGGNKKYVLQPSTLIKSDGASTQFDLNATFLYNKMVWLGVSYRTEDAVAPMIGYQYQFPNGKGALKLGYSYDVTTSELKNYSSGSHEVMLNYCFKIVPPVKLEIYRNPRFLM